ncbi:MAG: TGS domain-containing protein, partial [Candidatus Woesearchaeota archaeon]|nr:TGS domain-containing protein [Candidatus Woesearchaeota archaeon]
KQLSGLNITERDVKNAMHAVNLEGVHPVNWSEEQLMELAITVRKTKPMIVAANKMDIPCAEANLKRIQQEFPDMMIIPCSGDAELTLKQAAKANLIQYVQGNDKFTVTGTVSDKQRAALEFIQKNVLDKFGSTGVQKVLNAAVFDLLKYVAIFPGGVNKLADQYGRVLPDCFLLPPNSTAFDFAGKIHTDLQKNFVAAIDVKSKRKVGREQILKNRDVVEIMTK